MPRKRNRRKQVQAERRAEIERNQPVREKMAAAREATGKRVLVGGSIALLAVAAGLDLNEETSNE